MPKAPKRKNPLLFDGIKSVVFNREPFELTLIAGMLFFRRNRTDIGWTACSSQFIAALQVELCR
jgi:hypothetical protein